MDNFKKSTPTKSGKTIDLAVEQLQRMPEERQTLVRERLAKIGIDEKDFTLATWLGAIEHEMNNPASFKKATTADYKLNCIFAQIKLGKWTPLSIIPKTSPEALQPNPATKLHQQLQQLHRDKYGWEQVVNNPQPYQTGDDYANSAKRELAAVTQKITELNAVLQHTQQQENSH